MSDALNARVLMIEHTLYFSLAALLRDSPDRDAQLGLILNGTEALLTRQSTEGDPEQRRHASEALAYWPDFRRRLSGIGMMPRGGD